MKATCFVAFTSDLMESLILKSLRKPEKPTDLLILDLANNKDCCENTTFSILHKFSNGVKAQT